MEFGKENSFLAGVARDAIPFTHAEGPWVFDAAGSRYVDFLSGNCVGNTGWSNRAIRDTLRAYSGPAYVVPTEIYEPAHRLAGQLAEIAPGDLEVCFRATGGSEAVDIALQLALNHTGRKKFVSIEGAYHGNTLAARSIGKGDDITGHLPGCQKIGPPLDENAAKKLETLLKKEDIAAFIIEPIITNLAVCIPDKEFMTEARRLCLRYGTLFIADEVASAFYRTGRLFACEHFDLEPDIMCLGKAITGGYAPMGAVITTRAVARSAAKTKLEFYSTYGWHPLCIEAALANLEYLRQHTGRLLQSIADAGALIEERLAAMDFAKPPKIRRVGLAIAADLGNKSSAAMLERNCRGDGLLINAHNQSIVMFPPVNVHTRTVHEALDILERNVARLSPRHDSHPPRKAHHI